MVSFPFSSLASLSFFRGLPGSCPTSTFLSGSNEPSLSRSTDAIYCVTSLFSPSCFPLFSPRRTGKVMFLITERVERGHRHHGANGTQAGGFFFCGESLHIHKLFVLFWLTVRMSRFIMCMSSTIPDILSTAHLKSHGIHAMLHRCPSLCTQKWHHRERHGWMDSLLSSPFPFSAMQVAVAATETGVGKSSTPHPSIHPEVERSKRGDTRKQFSLLLGNGILTCGEK